MVQCGAVWCSVVQCGAVWCSVVQCGVVWCILKCVAVCCSMLAGMRSLVGLLGLPISESSARAPVLHCVAVFCILMQYVR